MRWSRTPAPGGGRRSRKELHEIPRSGSGCFLTVGIGSFCFRLEPEIAPTKMNPNAKVRKLHARVFARRHAPQSDFLVSSREFRFAAQCERMRVDRNGSMVSLLFI